uniref:Reverse transcriptase/retrotransposon-derived protein RNase H-like domain-containing protein n=1 Tax=Sinocyclocheilus anshuiensis TaxID=1608454 RepID=A0A671K7S9_9TELE
MVIGLCAAFFSIPVHQRTQPLFAFCFKGLARSGFKASKEKLLIDHKAPLSTVLNWTDEAMMHFNRLKQAITTAPALGLPQYNKPFHLHVRETAGIAMGVLVQEHCQLDTIVQGMQSCLRAVAVAAVIFCIITMN